VSRKKLAQATTLVEKSQRGGLRRNGKAGKNKKKKGRGKQKFGQKGVNVDQKDAGRPTLQRSNLTESFRAHKTGDGRTYYEHEVTGEVMWNVPEGATVVEKAKQKKKGRKSLSRTQTGSEVHTDDASGRKYKLKNGSSEWLNSGEIVIEGDDEKSAVAAAVASQMGGQKLKKRRPSFREHTAENGKSYYHNVETGETTWKKPADEDLIM
jgi:hypothetical protein